MTDSCFSFVSPSVGFSLPFFLFLSLSFSFNRETCLPLPRDTQLLSIVMNSLLLLFIICGF